MKTKLTARESVELASVAEGDGAGYRQLALLIARWNLDDENGVRDVTPENIAELWGDDVVTLTNKAREIMGARTPEQERDFTSGSTPGSKKAAPRRAHTSEPSTSTSSSTATSD